ncbi:MAG: DUF4245 domain-containing protein [Mycobacteriaceae bacterium]|nr:DUF4245 domain-containing protein [Mycobacteriaceae bacterium]
MANKPRILLGPKDLVWSLIPLVLLCLLFAGLAARCSFSPGGPKAGPVPTFDARNALRADAATMAFPIRAPKLPAGWKSNSGSHGTAVGAGGGPVTTVGFITPGNRYLELAQSSASEEALAKYVDSELVHTAATQVGGHTWEVYSAPTKESAWVADLGGVRTLIRGAGTEQEYTALAAGVAEAAPLTK